MRALPLAIALIGSSQRSANVAPTPGGGNNTASRNGTLEGDVRLEGGGVPVGADLFLQPLIDPRPVPVGEYIVSDDDIEATARGQFHGSIDERGRVRINEVHPGRYVFAVQVPGYISPETFPSMPEQITSGHSGSESADNIVTVSAGVVTTFHLKLQRGGSIAGIARFDDGTVAPRNHPIFEEIALTLLSKRVNGSFDYTAGVGAAHADAAGRFTFPNLPRGDYVVMTIVPGPLMEIEKGQTPMRGGLIFSGGTSSLSKASVIHIIGTEMENTEMILPTRGLCDVSGRVLAANGSVLTRGLVRLRPMDDGPSGSIPISATGASIGKDGTFQFYSLVPERYEMWVELQSDIAFVGMTEDHQGIRMLATPPPPYISPRLSLELFSGKTEPLVLQLKTVNDPTFTTAR